MHLIPGHFKLAIPQTRINNIYYELSKLDLQYVNSVAVLFRVFLELSVDDYAKRKRITLKKVTSPKKIGAKPLTKDMTLREKLKTVADYLEAEGVCDKQELQGIRSLVNNRMHVLSIDTLNAYVHNKDYSPTATELKQKWDNIQVFVERLWTL